MVSTKQDEDHTTTHFHTIHTSCAILLANYALCAQGVLLTSHFAYSFCLLRCTSLPLPHHICASKSRVISYHHNHVCNANIIESWWHFPHKMLHPKWKNLPTFMAFLAVLATSLINRC